MRLIRWQLNQFYDSLLFYSLFIYYYLMKREKTPITKSIDITYVVKKLYW